MKDDTHKITDWANEPTFDDLNTDLANAQSTHDIYLTKLDKYREDLEGGPDIKAKYGKSTHKPLVIRKSLEWKLPAMAEPFLSMPSIFRIKPMTYKDVDAAKQQELLLNHYWNTKVGKIELVNKIVRVCASEGTVVVKNGWVVEEVEELVPTSVPKYASPEESFSLLQAAVMEGSMSSEEAQAMMQSGKPVQIGTEIKNMPTMKLIKNHATHEVLDNEDVIVDPTCSGDIQNAKFVIHKYTLDLSTLTKDKYEELEDGTSRGIYHNLDKINFSIDNENYDERDTDGERAFVFADKARKKVQVYEYWGEWDINGKDITTPIVATWIDGTLIRLEKNPFIHQKLPFSSTVYMPVKGEFHGEPDGALLSENQKQIGILNRAALDITTTQAIGQKIINEELFSSPAQWDQYDKGNDARCRADMDPKNAIFKQNVEPVNSSLFQMWDIASKEVESMTGTKSFNNGVTGDSLGSSATGVRSAMDATAKRELGILRKLSTQLFTTMARQDLANASVFASPEEVVRLTDTEFVTVSKEHMKGEVDLIVDISTPEKDHDTAEQLAFLLQTNQAHMDETLGNKVLAEIIRLRGMPDLAHHIETYQKEPSEQEVKAQQEQLRSLELSNSKLEAEIALLAKQQEEVDSRVYERLSRTEENTKGDTVKKQAEANLANAQANKVQSEADILDGEYVASQDGSKRKAEVDDLVYKEEMRSQTHSDKDMAKLKAEELKQMYVKLNNKQGDV